MTLFLNLSGLIGYLILAVGLTGLAAKIPNYFFHNFGFSVLNSHKKTRQAYFLTMATYLSLQFLFTVWFSLQTSIFDTTILYLLLGVLILGTPSLLIPYPKPQHVILTSLSFLLAIICQLYVSIKLSLINHPVAPISLIISSALITISVLLLRRKLRRLWLAEASFLTMLFLWNLSASLFLFRNLP
ncbi:MAG: hypothetical protein UY21_C0022G0007 [Microgenomates group bacterium GW2011_GWA1_48_10]|uniref:Uncharacterized protein n=1 Tax=Candidatus Gottesmanbacteria bacterium RIFCSPHIGHO2_01_FULL_47_48 TaxID=1798381 RepID=A0A1F6A192_9BACT|nr:MAG: hypothetical protein UY21_C0022G0007 [Microgenomates group bacterium GW2011_GWA1_48_10]OGG18441.1 MAG: hypothetical protein A2721_01490 [Candidatus Gottesmanbacteria bacterium RIFCSPHIGHO2_01_FULL_47_48]